MFLMSFEPEPLRKMASYNAYLSQRQRFDDSNLKVEAGSRVSYLKINVKNAADIDSATLRMTVKGDQGSGTIHLFASHGGINSSSSCLFFKYSCSMLAR